MSKTAHLRSPSSWFKSCSSKPLAERLKDQFKSEKVTLLLCTVSGIDQRFHFHLPVSKKYAFPGFLGNGKTCAS